MEHFVSAEMYVRKCMKWIVVLELIEDSHFDKDGAEIEDPFREGGFISVLRLQEDFGDRWFYRTISSAISFRLPICTSTCVNSLTGLDGNQQNLYSSWYEYPKYLDNGTNIFADLGNSGST